MANAIQKLYESCKATFCRREGSLSSLAIQPVRSQLDCIEPCDVGLDENFFAQLDQGFGCFGTRNSRKSWYSPVARWCPPISYLHIYECDEFSMGIFCLPTSAIIPLHNHPGMTVLSKLLYGSMHVKAYDWVDTFVEVDQLQPRLAKLEVDRVMSAPSETTVLYPTSGGNIHQFTAVTSCAVLDVLAPPYSTLDGRDCTYYRDFPYLSRSDGLFDNWNVDGSEDGLAWLEEFQPPDDFVVKTFPYKGPRIVCPEGL
eukprot:c22578_g1_i1 orf=1113-1880(+)